MTNTILILGAEYRNGYSTFSGKDNGEYARKRLKIDNIDNTNEIISIKVPCDTTSINPSFFIGLFFNSFKKCGSIEKFNKKFKFDFSNLDVTLKKYLMQDIEDCLYRCNTELENEKLIKKNME